MHTTFNSASLAKLSKSQLYALLAEQRGLLARETQADRRVKIQASISAIQSALKLAP